MHHIRFGQLGLAAFAIVMGIGISAQAAPIAPGGSIVTPAEPDPTGGTVVADSGNVAFAGGGPDGFTGTLRSRVLLNDPSNPFGGLTFTYLLTNDATSHTSLGRMTNIDFTGFLTDVSYQAPTSGRPSTTTDRSASGGTIGWSFSASGLGEVAPGQQSALLVVQTNSNTFNPGQANIIDGSVATATSFGPAPLVPEPTSLALLSASTLVVLRRRRH